VPQLLLSDGRSVQVPLQQPCPLAQQVPLQLIWPAAQHTPSWQIWSLVQQVQVLKDSFVEQQTNCPGGQ